MIRPLQISAVALLAFSFPVSAQSPFPYGRPIRESSHCGSCLTAVLPQADVTWEVVAQLNAKHTQENARVSKSTALELLLALGVVFQLTATQLSGGTACQRVRLDLLPPICD